jgi:hypothetical protein
MKYIWGGQSFPRYPNFYIHFQNKQGMNDPINVVDNLTQIK